MQLSSSDMPAWPGSGGDGGGDMWATRARRHPQRVPVAVSPPAHLPTDRVGSGNQESWGEEGANRQPTLHAVGGRESAWYEARELRRSGAGGSGGEPPHAQQLHALLI